MPADDALLFIDANKYLDLYRTNKGRHLLAPLGEQVTYIFVTQQIVNEVQRNKILVAAEFLNQKLKSIKLQSFNLPDHLSGTNTDQGKEILQQMSKIGQDIKKVNSEVDDLALGILAQIGCSEDEVSNALSPIFAKAVPYTPEELQRARDRRELGNPPGKSTNPIGDQLTWEQILTHFKGKKRLWIISRDGDYGTVYGGKGFLNRFLYDELCKVAAEPEAYLFNDLVEGITHFVDTTGVKAEKRLTPEEAREIEREEKSLPDLIQPNGILRQVVADMGRLREPSETTRQVLGDMGRLRQPSETLRQVLGDLERLRQPGETLRQVLGDVERLRQPNETLQQVLGNIERLGCNRSSALTRQKGVKALCLGDFGVGRVVQIHAECESC